MKEENKKQFNDKEVEEAILKFKTLLLFFKGFTYVKDYCKTNIKNKKNGKF